MRKHSILRGIALLLILALPVAVTGCGSAAVKTEEARPFHLMFATDLHFYAPELVGDFDAFTQELLKGDGKVAQYSSELVETLTDTALREKPDALLLGGDLTLNGEYDSHRVLAEMLKPVSDAGIPVLVVPGNHDINNLGAVCYADGDYCASLDEAGFSELYSPLGMDDAISRDEESLSYLYALSGDLYLLMIDSCDYDGFGRSTGSISDKTKKWIERQLKAAKKAKATVISVSHHNLLQHSPRFEEPYLMHDAADLVKLLERYNVKLNMTGHIHTQHILRAETEKGLSEIVTGAMSVQPNYYGSIEVGADKSITYKATSLDVSGWAAKTGATDANLLGFAAYSESFFDATNSARMTQRLEAYGLSEEEYAQMRGFAELANRRYFAGTHVAARDELLAHPGYALWAEKGEQQSLPGYIESILGDTAEDHSALTIK